MKGFLPQSLADLRERGWDELDFIFVSGDAYVDHPGFGAAVICRVLEAHGYRVGIIAQPDWRSAKDFRRLGKPRLAFLVSSGNLDSVLAEVQASNLSKLMPDGSVKLRDDGKVLKGPNFFAPNIARGLGLETRENTNDAD